MDDEGRLVSRLQLNSGERKYLQEVGRRVLEARTKAGMSQTRLAAIADTSVSQLQRVESGAASIELISLLRLAMALGVAVGRLTPPKASAAFQRATGKAATDDRNSDICRLAEAMGWRNLSALGRAYGLTPSAITRIVDHRDRSGEYPKRPDGHVQIRDGLRYTVIERDAWVRGAAERIGVVLPALHPAS